MITYDCGCVNEVMTPGGALRCVSKCTSHQRRYNDPVSLDRAYFENIGVLRKGVRAKTKHVQEVEEALGPLPEGKRVLEVGCGASPYCKDLLARGCTYHAVEPSTWAAGYMRETYDVVVMNGRLEWAHSHLRIQGTRYEAVLCAHSLEHMEDAPGALALMSGLLVKGGLLYLVVPDDSDPTNPDHLWFFNSESLRHVVSGSGLVVKKLEVRKYVQTENFLYCLAEKPTAGQVRP